MNAVAAGQQQLTVAIGIQCSSTEAHYHSMPSAVSMAAGTQALKHGFHGLCEAMSIAAAPSQNCSNSELQVKIAATNCVASWGQFAGVGMI